MTDQPNLTTFRLLGLAAALLLGAPASAEALNLGLDTALAQGRVPATAPEFAASSPLPPALPVNGPAAAAVPGTYDPALETFEEITVRPGDTAYRLSREFDLTVEQLLQLNGLATHDLEVGQVLRVRRIPPHQVMKGDTVYSLAKRYGLTVEALSAANSLGAEARIELGQWLAIPVPPRSRPQPAPGQPVPLPSENGTAAPEFTAKAPPSQALEQMGEGGGRGAPPSEAWRANALALLDTPYVYGGNSERGIDCSAFVVRVFQPLGVNLPRTSAQQAQVGQPVARRNLRGGDLVFFDTVGRGSVTHVGIYLGDDQFVNANSYYGRVVIDRLERDRYWSPRYLSARRILNEMVARQPVHIVTVAQLGGSAD